MSIRGKIVAFALAIGLSEAILIGMIGYNGVASVSKNAEELRHISSAIEGVRELTAGLSALSDPAEVMETNGAAGDHFRRFMDDLDRQVATCVATSCHDYKKRPPEMAAHVRDELRAVRAAGLSALAEPASDARLRNWIERVDAPARRIARTTNEMTQTLMTAARDIEETAKQTEQSALLLVASVTVFSILVAVALCFPVARGMTRPLERLEEQTRRVARGELGVRASEDGPRELRELARSFNLMQDDLARHRAELLAHRDRLERDVEERIAELRRKDELLKRSEQLAGIGLVAGMVAHDLNNPLTNVLLNAEHLAALPDRGENERALAAELLRHARRCREIAAGIRTLVREGDFELAPCAPEALVREAVRHLRYKWEPKGLDVAVEAPARAACCQCNAPKITQALLNLLDNAIETTDNGGRVTVRLAEREHRLVIEVADPGPGIPRRIRPALFHTRCTTKPDGTGLGLAIARRIVEQHEGVLDYVTRDHEDAARDGGPTGTTFRVTLPLAPEHGDDPCGCCGPGGG